MEYGDEVGDDHDHDCDGSGGSSDECDIGDGAVGGPAPKLGQAPVDWTEAATVARREAAMHCLAQVVTAHQAEQERAFQEGVRRRESKSRSLPSSFFEGVSETVDGTPHDFRDNSCIIFDWDDTLFPTWYVENVIRPCRVREDAPVADMFLQPMALHAQAVEEVLRIARTVARVAIVTLAQRPWAQRTAETYLPDLRFAELLRELEIPIYYAREHIKRAQARTDEEGVNLLVVCKRNAMVKCLKKLRKKTGRMAGNIICIGDSSVEHEAIKEVLWSRDGHSQCKSVLLMANPSLANLTNELKLIASSICKMTSFEDDFDFSMDSSCPDNFTS